MSKTQFHKYIFWFCKTEKGSELNPIRCYIVIISDFHYKQDRNEACITRLLYEASIIYKNGILQHKQLELATELLTLQNFRSHNYLVAQLDVTYPKLAVLTEQGTFSTKRDQILTSKCNVNNYRIIIFRLPTSRPVWIRKTNQMSLFVFFISLPIVAQHVSGNHVPIIRS